jgi:hypothetical protein
MLYGHFAVSLHQPVPDRALLTALSNLSAFGRPTMGLPLGPPVLAPASPSETR